MKEEYRTFLDCFRFQCKRNADHAFLEAPNQSSLSYFDLIQLIENTAEYLRNAGLKANSRIVMATPNSAETITCFLGVAEAAVACPINPQETRQSCARYFEELKPSALIWSSEAGEGAKEAALQMGITILKLVPDKSRQAGSFSLQYISGRFSPNKGCSTANGQIDPNRVILILPTSGSTGRPKRVPLRIRNFLITAQNARESLNLSPDDREILVTPLFHIHGLLTGILYPAVSGGTIICPGMFAVDKWMDWLRAFKPTWYSVPPAIHRETLRILETEDLTRPVPSLRFVRSGSAPLEAAFIQRLQDRLGVQVVEAYGLTEAPNVSATSIDGPLVGSVGRSVGPEIAILDRDGNELPLETTGEVALRGPSLFQGYDGDEFGDRYYEENWFCTGDLGRLNQDGYLFIEGRIKEMINRGGEKIMPLEVDRCLASHPSVAMALSFGFPHQTLGEDVAAAVILRPGMSASENELQTHVREDLGEMKTPVRILPVDAMPCGPTGKPLRSKLWEALEDRFADEFEAPCGELENTLAGYFSELLNVESIGRNTHFFLTGGGNSLMAMRVISRIQKHIGVSVTIKDFFRNPTIQELAELIQELQKKNGNSDTARLLSKDNGSYPSNTREDSEPSGLSENVMRFNGCELSEFDKPGSSILVKRSDGEESYPLSLGQQRLWFLERFEPNTAAYNIKLALRIKGALDKSALENSIREVVRRHDTLRTRIDEKEGQPVQIVAPHTDFELATFDSRFGEEELSQLIRKEVVRPFDLSQGPLFRVCLFLVLEQESILLIVTHHIISDGWSLNIFKNEILSGYKALSEGSPSPLPPLKARYFDFCDWQLGEEGCQAEQLDYWKKRLSGAEPALELPTDFARPARQTLNGAEARIELHADLVADLRKLTSDGNVSLFVALLGAFQVLLHRYCGMEDIIVGVPVAGRSVPEFEELIGFFINSLPMRATFGGNPVFQDFLLDLNRHVLDAFAHQEVPYERLLEELEPDRDLSRSPLFQAMFAFQNYPTGEVPLPGLEIQPYDVASATSTFDVSLYAYEASDSLSLRLEYNRDLFRESTMRRMLGHFEVLLKAVSSDPARPVSDLPLLYEEETRQLLVDWNETDKVFDGDRLTHELIDDTARRAGDKCAAIFPGKGALPESRLGYRELVQRSNRLANYLIKLGVGPETIVGICLDRREDMLVSLLGVMKSGGAYMPLDATFPQERLQFMLEDSQARLILTEKELASRFEGGSYEIVDLASASPVIAQLDTKAPDIAIGKEALAYVIYTSGSTGKPKGVEILHGALSNFLRSMQETPGIREEDRILAITTLSFDIAALEIFLPLIAGACIVVADSGAVTDGQRIQKLISNRNISLMQGTPSFWRLLLESGWEGDPSINLLCGGEPLDASLAMRLLRQCGRLWNMYGPTETTIWSSCHEMKPGEPILIGKPIANTSMVVLDGGFNPMPIGVPGELYIGGEGLARGYRYRPELTAERFVELPFDPGATYYRTGDRARWVENGCLECLGRTDHQVKLRGYRIELGEIEAVISAHPDVREAAVVVQGEKSEDQRLVGYLSVRTSNLSSDVLQDHVGKVLPEYMIPSRFVTMDKLPKTANGKVDRKALPDPADDVGRLETDFKVPRSSIEKTISAIWSEVLGISKISLQDSFFRVGGHSLTSVQLISKINRKFSLNLSVATLFEHSTFEKFCSIVESRMTTESKSDRDENPDSCRREAGTTILSSGSKSGSDLEKKENVFRGIKNRLLQLLARITPNSMRIRLHRWRGVQIGERVGIGYDTILETSCPWLVSIGDRSRIGMRVTVIGHFADMEDSSSNRHGGATVRIEDDVWIGPGVIILPNVTIGHGSVVAAGSTITMTVPPKTFVQGNPAKPVARCRVPLRSGVKYEDFIQNLEPLKEVSGK